MAAKTFQGYSFKQGEELAKAEDTKQKKRRLLKKKHYFVLHSTEMWLYLHCETAQQSTITTKNKQQLAFGHN